MKIHCIQHVPYNGVGCVFDWATLNGYPLSFSKLYEECSFPALEDFDMLFIAGGPLSIFDYEKFPWLKEEKQFIKAAIAQGKFIIGVCLGAQLLADALGAEVMENKEPEFGWMPIQLQNDHSYFSDWPEKLDVLHWHRDTFDLPSNSERVACSEACDNQGFVVNDHLIGLQFHIEFSELELIELVYNSNELQKWGGQFMQSQSEVLNGMQRVSLLNTLMFSLLDKIAAKMQPQALLV